jgi:hypothetical protein
MMDRKKPFPRWIFAFIAIGALIACGIFIGKLTSEGFTSLRILQALAFDILGLIMFWGTQGRN